MNDEKVDINRVRELITSYHKSVSQIKRYYERPSYMGLLNVGRKELPHSSFIKWLFSSSTFNQNSADSPIMHLLDIAVKRANQQDKIGDDKAISASLSDSIYGRLFSISNTSCSLEEVIDKRRCDIVIRCKIKDTERELNICIENKVLSSEHTSQTEAYEKYYSSKNENADWLFLFLTPISSAELDDYFSLSKKERCTSEKFIQINYQDLLDYVLEPLINSVDKNSQAYFILDDYINTLRYPVTEDNDKKRTIMAIGEKETKLLNDFWEGNHELIELALEAMSCNKNLDEDVRNKAKDAYESMTSLQTARKDSTKFVIIDVSDSSRDDNSGNGYKKVEIAKKFADIFCDNIAINNADDANRLIQDIIQTKTQNIFKQEKSKTHNHAIRLKNGETTLYLNTNIWGESTDYWRKLREYLEKDNEYFKIESLR